LDRIKNTRKMAAMHAEQQRALDYLARKGTAAPAETLRAQLRDAFAKTEQAFDAVEGALRGRQPKPGKWSPHEILDHLVISHGPAVPQFASLLDGVDPEGIAIPADLHRDQRPPWDALRAELGDIHQQFLRLVDGATDQHSLAPKAAVEMVIKVDGTPVHWIERIDWKAFIQALRVHTLEHLNQLERTLRNE
jgi:DinB superfamily